jgi:hypothetical protein
MVSGRKPRNLWILVAATYGAVAATTIIALVWYQHASAGTKVEEPAGNISVGTVWVTMYPGAIVHDTTSAKHGDITEGTMKFGSGDPPGKVLAFYRTTLHKSGFLFQANSDARTVRAIGRAGKVEVIVSAEPHGEGSEAQIATVDRQKK